MTRQELKITKDEFRKHSELVARLATLLDDSALVLALQALKNTAAAKRTDPKAPTEVIINAFHQSQGVLIVIEALEELAGEPITSGVPDERTHWYSEDLKVWLPHASLPENLRPPLSH